MADGAVVGSATFEMRASTERLKADLQVVEATLKAELALIEARSGSVKVRADSDPLAATLNEAERRARAQVAQIDARIGKITPRADIAPLLVSLDEAAGRVQEKIVTINARVGKVTLRGSAAPVTQGREEAERATLASTGRIGQHYDALGREAGQALATAGSAGSQAVAKITADAERGIALNRAQLLELSHVGRSVADSLAAGINPLRIVAFEGGRVFQVASKGSGGLQGSLAALGRIFNPVVLGVTALGAALVGLFAIEQSAERSQQRLTNALRGIGEASGATVGDLNRIADAAAAAGEGSTHFEKAAVATFLNVGLTKEQLAPAIALIQRFAAVSGLDAPEALSTLAKAMHDPAGAAKEFGDGILNLSAEQIRHIELLEEQGRKTEAVSALIAAIGGAVQGARPHLTQLGESFASLTGSIQSAIDKLGQFLTRLVQVPAAQKLAELQAQRARIVEGTARVDPESGLAGVQTDAGNRAELADVDAKIAAVRREIGADLASPGNVKAAKDRKRSRDQQGLVAELDPDIAQIEKLKAGITGAREALKNLVPGGPSADELNAAITRGQQRIEQIEKRGQPRARKERAPADTTAAGDSRASTEADDADKDYAQALKEAAAEVRQRTQANTIAGKEALAIANAAAQDDAAHGTIQATLQGKLDRIADEEIKLRGAKNDAHKAEEQATLAAARDRLLAAAQVRQDTADAAAQAEREKASRDAQVATIQRNADAQESALRSQLAIAQIDAATAVTSADRRKAELNILTLEKALADALIKARFDVEDRNVLPGPDAPARHAEITKDRAKAQAESDAGFAARGVQTLRSTESPLERFKREGIDAAHSVGDTLENEAVKAMDELNDGLAEAITSGRSLGDVLHSVFASMTADLVRYLAKQAEIGILGGQSGGGIGSFLSSFFHPLQIDSTPLAVNTGPALSGVADVGKLVNLASTFGFADGGRVSGPGTGKSDSIIARLSAGEFVVPADVAARHLPLLEALRAGMPGFADGGLVAALPSHRLDPNSNFARGVATGAVQLGGQSSLTFDLRGAVMTSDLIEQMQTIATTTGGQVLGAALSHTNQTVARAQRMSAAASRQDLTKF